MPISSNNKWKSKISSLRQGLAILSITMWVLLRLKGWLNLEWTSRSPKNSQAITTTDHLNRRITTRSWTDRGHQMESSAIKLIQLLTRLQTKWKLPNSSIAASQAQKIGSSKHNASWAHPENFQTIMATSLWEKVTNRIQAATTFNTWETSTAHERSIWPETAWWTRHARRAAVTALTTTTTMSRVSKVKWAQLD